MKPSGPPPTCPCQGSILVRRRLFDDGMRLPTQKIGRESGWSVVPGRKDRLVNGGFCEHFAAPSSHTAPGLEAPWWDMTCIGLVNQTLV